MFYEAAPTAAERFVGAEGRPVRPCALALIRDIFGKPYRPVAFDPRWRTLTAAAVARAVYDQRAFEGVPLLADALEHAGCTDAELLGHLRGPGSHVRGCWPVDLRLGKS
jgi:hypothetical protein